MADEFAYDSFRQAKWFYRGRRAPIRLIVTHCTVSKEMGTGAEAVADYFTRAIRKGSTHAVADSNGVVGCVHDPDTAFGAAGANSDGLHLELVGMPDQTRAQWLDDFGRSMFGEARALLDFWSKKHAIPLRWLTVAQVRDGKTRGVTDHATVEKAFPSTGHWDPGHGFPHDEFLTQEDEMTPTERLMLFDAWVRNSYAAAGKKADEAGVLYWVGQLDAGKIDAHGVRRQIAGR